MRSFKLTWRLSPLLWLSKERWADFLKLITRHDDVADEVALFISDDMFLDLTPLEDRQRQADIAAERIADIHALGRTAGINVWPSFDLYAMERAYYPQFRRMVNVDGKVVDSIACPTGEEFLAYIQEKYRIFARSGADFIWVDDDCRFTTWGETNFPCFCPHCVSHFENGRFSSREELVNALNQKENEDLRVRWSAYGADRLAAFCKAVRTAVDEVNPAIDTPFMTVGATHTTFAGDYIEKCMEALHSRRGRPGHGFYTDRNPDVLVWKTMEVGRQVRHYPEYVEDIFWEEDSHPQTYLNKSLSTRRKEVTMALLAGCSGIAFNHQGGNSGIDRMLAREVDALHQMRPFWERYLAFSQDLPWKGFYPADSWFMTAHMDCENGWFNENHPDYDITRPESLGPCGLPLTARKDHASGVLLSGKTLRAFSREELLSILSGNVLMDIDALKELERQGLGHLTGVQSGDPVPAAQCYLAVHPFSGPFADFGHSTISAMTPSRLQPLSDSVQILGYMKSGFVSTQTYPCITLFENELGGKIVVDGYDPWYYTDDPHRIYFLSSILSCFDSPVRLRYDDPFQVSRVQPFIRGDEKKASVLIWNASLDESLPVDVLISGSMTEASLLLEDGSTSPLSCRREGDALCVRLESLAPRQMVCILAE